MMILGVKIGEEQEERRLQRKFHYLHLRGEWFSFSPEMMNEFEPFTKGRSAVPAPKKLIADQLRAAREKVGESQAEFAERFGVDQSTVSRWESMGPPVHGPVRRMIEQIMSEIDADAEAA
ncbi:MAG: helix-turn-helix domain-containing protein [Patescibacteria group bacterium]|nr:helix-turn-helix domain-containing protein [Patescibacteria group bacterium]